MVFFKFINEDKIQLLTRNAILENGIIIGNASTEIMARNGYYPLVNTEVPEYDRRTERIKTSYRLCDGKIITERSVIKKEKIL